MWGGNTPVTGFDCSGFILWCYKEAGVPIPGGDMTAEGIRQACDPVAWEDVQPGDVLLFENTYPSDERTTHIGFSYGAGTQRMLDTHEPGGVQKTMLSGSWQTNLFEARRNPALAGAPPPPTGTVVAIDVSNHQPTDISHYISSCGATHVIVKAYQSIEVDGGRMHAKAQIASAHSCGASVATYVWLYAGVPAEQQVDDALSLHVPPILWLDIEPYTDGSCPTAAEIHAAVDYCERIGQRVGIYTGKWVWDQRGYPPAWSRLPLWTADYNGDPDLDHVTLYGGWTFASGKQFTSTPIDQNTMLADVTA